MRTNINTQDYFENYFELQLDDLNYYENSLIQGTVKEDRISAVKRKIFIISLHTLIAKYSSGYSINELKEDFPLVIKRFVEGWEDDGNTPEDDIHFDDYILMLRMLSLGVLLETDMETFNKIVEVLNKSKRKDYLFSFIISYKRGSPYLIDKLTYEQFRPLYEISKETDKTKAINLLKNYLDKNWYKNMKLTYWYDNHKSKADTFFGYWSFESGALVKILGLDDSSLKEQQYYPYDMVHWKD